MFNGLSCIFCQFVATFGHFAFRFAVDFEYFSYLFIWLFCRSFSSHSFHSAAVIYFGYLIFYLFVLICYFLIFFIFICKLCHIANVWFTVSSVFTLFTEISHQYPELPAPQNVVLVFISIWYGEICYIQCWSHCTVYWVIDTNVSPTWFLAFFAAVIYFGCHISGSQHFTILSHYAFTIQLLCYSIVN